jgi:Helicase associated domain
VNTQRVLFAKQQRGEATSLTSIRIQQLDDIDFVWDDYGKRWTDLFEELVEYRKVHGHWYVSVVPGPCSRRRFHFGTPENTLLRLILFCETNKCSLVPRSYRENPRLGRWVYTQRTRYNQGVLVPKRVRILEELGFVWKVFSRTSWFDLYEELVHFNKRYGHCRVPRQYEENRKLGSWVQTQRTEMKNYRLGRHTSLTKERLQLLNDLRFEWKINQSK